MKRDGLDGGRAAGEATVRVDEDSECNESGRAPFADSGFSQIYVLVIAKRSVSIERAR